MAFNRFARRYLMHGSSAPKYVEYHGNVQNRKEWLTYANDSDVICTLLLHSSRFFSISMHFHPFPNSFECVVTLFSSEIIISIFLVRTLFRSSRPKYYIVGDLIFLFIFVSPANEKESLAHPIHLHAYEWLSKSTPPLLHSVSQTQRSIRRISLRHI